MDSNKKIILFITFIFSSTALAVCPPPRRVKLDPAVVRTAETSTDASAVSRAAQTMRSSNDPLASGNAYSRAASLSKDASTKAQNATFAADEFRKVNRTAEAGAETFKAMDDAAAQAGDAYSEVAKTKPLNAKKPVEITQWRDAAENYANAGKTEDAAAAYNNWLKSLPEESRVDDLVAHIRNLQGMTSQVAKVDKQRVARQWQVAKTLVLEFNQRGMMNGHTTLVTNAAKAWAEHL